MNYRHIYHAGNFADVVKHVVLIAALELLQKKEAPLCFMDTHAGIGLYDLTSLQSQKKQEFGNGALKIFDAVDIVVDPAVSRYRSMIHALNADQLHFYPGSPLIASSCLRHEDRLILCELHAEDVLLLKDYFFKDKAVAVHHIDGYLGMKAFLPPALKRGFVLIDPPFEKMDEFDRIILSVQNALKCWRAGQFMIWYPIKDERAVADFERKIRSLSENIIIHYRLNDAVEMGKLAGCGIALIHPVWQLKERLMDSVFPSLSNLLNISIKCC